MSEPPPDCVSFFFFFFDPSLPHTGLLSMPLDPLIPGINDAPYGMPLFKTGDGDQGRWPQVAWTATAISIDQAIDASSGAGSATPAIAFKIGQRSPTSGSIDATVMAHQARASAKELVGQLRGTNTGQVTRWPANRHGAPRRCSRLAAASSTRSATRTSAPISADFPSSPLDGTNALAVTKRSRAGGLNSQPGTSYGNFGGYPAPSIYNWFPEVNAGTFTGMLQALERGRYYGIWPRQAGGIHHGERRTPAGPGAAYPPRESPRTAGTRGPQRGHGTVGERRQQRRGDRLPRPRSPIRPRRSGGCAPASKEGSVIRRGPGPPTRPGGRSPRPATEAAVDASSTWTRRGSLCSLSGPTTGPVLSR